MREKSVSARMEMMRTLLTPLICGTIWQPLVAVFLATGTVSSSTYPLHSQVPVLIHEGLVSQREERHLPGLDGRGRGIYREKFDVQSV